jgi:hypothetical protein
MLSPYVGQNSNDGNSCTLPEYLTNDVAVVFAYANTAVNPTLPAGWNSITTQAANSNGFRLGYRFLVAGDTTTGTWTNATFVIVVLYRDISAIGAAGSTTSASSTSTAISGFTPQIGTGSSWRVGFAGSAQTVSMSTPTGYTLRSSLTSGGHCMGIVVDFNAGIKTAAQITSTNGLTAVSAGGSVELRREWQNSNQNYMAVSAGDGMSVSEKIR